MNASTRVAPRETPVRDLPLIFRRFWTTLFLFRCPACGRGHIAKNHFQLRATCPRCGVRFERDPGSFLVSMALNYFLTTALVGTTALVLALRFGFFEGMTTLLVVLACTVPVLIFRHVKALQLWLLWVFGFVYPDRQPSG